MKIGNWEIYIGFLYYELPWEWDNFDEALKRSRPVLNVIGIHLWNGKTDEGHMVEIRFRRKERALCARLESSHLPAYWMVEICDCSDCRKVRKKLRQKQTYQS